ncbi:hypothetical protein V2W45_1401006 [Cenococcum geophilum]
MVQRSIFSTPALLFVFARSSSQASLSFITASSTSSAAAQTHTISVGNGDYTFRPDVTQASPGDTIKFRFYPQNHSVVRAEYQFPCIPYEMTGKGKVGFSSGFKPVDAVLDEPPSWSLIINDTEPAFFYCSGPLACTRFGMVAVINPNASVSLQNQKDLALKSPYVLNPGDSFPGEGLLTTTSTIKTTSIPIYAYSTSTGAIPSSTPSPITSEHTELSTGAIVGICIGAITAILIAVALFFFIGRVQTLQQMLSRSNPATAMSSTTVPPSQGERFSNTDSNAFLPVQTRNYGNSAMTQPFDEPLYTQTVGDEPLRAGNLTSPFHPYFGPAQYSDW